MSNNAAYSWPTTEGFVVTHFLTVADVNRSAEFYVRVLGGTVVRSGEPTISQLANSWLMVNVGGGPTDDKPTVTLHPPHNPHEVSSFLNIRVADIKASYEQWRARGAEFLTEPKDHGAEIRCYMRDPDGYIIEVGQTTAPQGSAMRGAISDATDWERDRLERLLRSHTLRAFRGVASVALTSAVHAPHQLAQHPNKAPSHSGGGQGGSHLSKGAGGHAESPGPACTAQPAGGSRQSSLSPSDDRPHSPARVTRCDLPGT